VFGQIAFWLDYHSIYIASAISVFIAIFLYYTVFGREKARSH
jgi:hypothetical protein